MASKYLIQFRGRHVFNPSNFALVLCFLILGSGRVGAAPVLVGPALAGARDRAARDRRGRASRALTGRACSRSRSSSGSRSRAALGILALSGHAFSANWHLGPGRGRLLLEGADHLARGVHLPLVHDHRPEDGAGDRARPADLRGRDRPPRCAADRADADRVRGEGGAARDADDRLRGAAADHPRAGGARAPAAERTPGERVACAAAGRSARSPSPVRRAFAGLIVVAGSPARSVAALLRRRARGRRPGHDRAHDRRRLDHAADWAGRSRQTRSPISSSSRSRSSRRDASQAAAPPAAPTSRS